MGLRLGSYLYNESSSCCSSEKKNDKCTNNYKFLVPAYNCIDLYSACIKEFYHHYCSNKLETTQ